MKKDKVVILGSTGSIGTQSIDVIKSVGDKTIVGLACNSNIKLLYKQVTNTKCKYVAIYECARYKFKECLAFVFILILNFMHF